MERLLSVVPRDRLKIILFDDFVADTKGVYEEVLSFLEVPLDGRNDFADRQRKQDASVPVAATELGRRRQLILGEFGLLQGGN